MHTHVLTATQLAVLDRLKAAPAVATFYLAGGTALALRHGHRRSVDFDFFRTEPFEAEELLAAIENGCHGRWGSAVIYFRGGERAGIATILGGYGSTSLRGEAAFHRPAGAPTWRRGRPVVPFPFRNEG